LQCLTWCDGKLTFFSEITTIKQCPMGKYGGGIAE
jgi:hypothetical protein